MRVSKAACARWSTVVAVPFIALVLGAAGEATHRKATQFLLVPPLAVITYVLFMQPRSRHASVASIIVLPVAGALIGEAAYHFLGAAPWAFAVACAAVLGVQALLRATMPPALAIALLAILLKASGPYYPLDVCLATIAIAVTFYVWRALLWERCTDSPRAR